MSIINKNRICLNYLIGVLICGFVIYANYIHEIGNSTGYTTIMSFALLISVTTLSIFNKNNRLFVNMISTLVSTFCLGNLVRSVAIGGIFVYAIDLYLILGLVLMVDTAIIYVNKRWKNAYLVLSMQFFLVFRENEMRKIYSEIIKYEKFKKI